MHSSALRVARLAALPCPLGSKASYSHLHSAQYHKAKVRGCNKHEFDTGQKIEFVEESASSGILTQCHVDITTLALPSKPLVLG